MSKSPKKRPKQLITYYESAGNESVVSKEKYNGQQFSINGA